MKRNYIAALLILGVFLAGSALNYGQEVHKIVVDIPNAFTASGAKLPPGRYEISLAGALHQTVNFRRLDGKETGTAIISTMIAGESGQPTPGRLVFDLVGEEHFLSEVWMPGHDGFLITGYKNDTTHKHSVVKASGSK